jgi:hypothetical protein
LEDIRKRCEDRAKAAEMAGEEMVDRIDRQAARRADELS